jgi:hypothetical protein
LGYIGPFKARNNEDIVLVKILLGFIANCAIDTEDLCVELVALASEGIFGVAGGVWISCNSGVCAVEEVSINLATQLAWNRQIGKSHLCVSEMAVVDGVLQKLGRANVIVQSSRG